MKGWSKFYSKMKNCICKIINKDGKKGIGFFCRIPLNDELILFLITNNNILDEKDIENGNRIEFTLNDNKKSFILKINDSRRKLTNKELDVIFIEIKPSQDKINYFLDIDQQINTNQENLYNNKSIYLLLLNYIFGYMTILMFLLDYQMQ